MSKKALEIEEIEAKSNGIRAKIEVYETEKETNIAKAIEQWIMLTEGRKRLHNIEGLFLDVSRLAENSAEIINLDSLRTFANNVAEKLKGVADYYDSNTATVQKIHSILHELAVKKVELQTKNISSKKKCAFLGFFCN